MSVTLDRVDAYLESHREDFVAQLSTPRAAWVMVPAGSPTNDTIATLAGLLSDGDVVIDEVLRSGYRWRGQVLRPAMVRVRG